MVKRETLIWIQKKGTSVQTKAVPALSHICRLWALHGSRHNEVMSFKSSVETERTHM